MFFQTIRILYLTLGVFLVSTMPCLSEEPSEKLYLTVLKSKVEVGEQTKIFEILELKPTKNIRLHTKTFSLKLIKKYEACSKRFVKTKDSQFHMIFEDVSSGLGGSLAIPHGTSVQSTPSFRPAYVQAFSMLQPGIYLIKANWGLRSDVEEITLKSNAVTLTVYPKKIPEMKKDSTNDPLQAKVEKLIKAIHDKPDITDSKSSSEEEVDQLIKIGMPSLQHGVLELLLCDCEITRLRAERVLKRVTMIDMGYTKSKGWDDPSHEKKWLNLWVKNGDYSAGALEKPQRTSYLKWLSWVENRNNQ